MSDSPEYLLRWRGRQSGPFSLMDINRQLDEHQIGMGHEIQYQEHWISLEEFFLLLPQPAARAGGQRSAQRSAATSPLAETPPLPAGAKLGPPPNAPLPFRPGLGPVPAAPVAGRPEAPPMLPGAQSAPAPALRPRRRLVYALLGVLLGFSGVHNFYARNLLTGLLQFLLSIATYLLGFGIIVPWLWALVEAVVVRKDGKGIEMT